MEDKLITSIDRAIILLKTPQDYDKYISFKLSLLQENCWSCYWGKTWDTTLRSIYKAKISSHRDDLLIQNNENVFVLEQHESGPEIIVFLKPAIDLTKSIIDLITAIIKGLSKEPKKQTSGRIKITRRQAIKGKIEIENLIEIDIPMSDNDVKEITEKIRLPIN